MRPEATRTDAEAGMNLSKVFLFDLDGSLADYNRALLDEMNRLRAPGEPELTSPAEAWVAEHLKRRAQLITSQPGWWAELKPLENGMTIYRHAREMGFDCQVLTKGPRRWPRAWMEKVEWCQRHLGPDVDVHIVSDKGLVYGVALYDDYPDYVRSWLRHRPRGLVIMPAYPSNADFQHPNVVRFDGTNLDAVLRAMRAAYQRKTGEALRLG
jgi:hypothetical protein